MKYIPKHFAIMLLISTAASTTIKGMENSAEINNTITVQNRNNNEKSTLKLLYTSEQATPDGNQSNAVDRSISLNASFRLPLLVTSNENGSSSLTIFDPRKSKGMTISAQDNDIITLEKQRGNTIEIKNNGRSVGHFTTSK